MAWAEQGEVLYSNQLKYALPLQTYSKLTHIRPRSITSKIYKEQLLADVSASSHTSGTE